MVARTRLSVTLYYSTLPSLYLLQFLTFWTRTDDIKQYSSSPPHPAPSILVMTYFNHACFKSLQAYHHPTHSINSFHDFDATKIGLYTAPGPCRTFSSSSSRLCSTFPIASYEAKVESSDDKAPPFQTILNMKGMEFYEGKSALEKPKHIGRFLLVWIINLEVYKIPDVTGPVRKVSSSGGVPCLFSATVRQWAAPRGTPALCIVSLCAALPAISWQLSSTLHYSLSSWFTTK